MTHSSAPMLKRRVASSLDRWVRPVVDLRRVAFAAQGYSRYRRDWRAYARMPGSEPLRLEDAYPCLFDRTASTSFDAHYFYQSVWAAQRIASRRPALHVDVGSLTFFVGMLTAVTQVAFLDIRPIVAAVEGFQAADASLLDLPFAADTVQSLSCLHVAEHVGLGRYGDPLDPQGTRKAARELARVLAPGGDLYFSLPVGEARVEFNAHRIHAPEQILAYFHGLSLEQFCLVSDRGDYLQDVPPGRAAGERYACGLFHFTKLPGSPTS